MTVVEESSGREALGGDAPIPYAGVTAGGLLGRPNLTVFVSSCCILVLELVAERIIAPYVGMSLYTWTGIIGVVLAGMSLGNYLGGRVADRWASPRFLGAILVAGGLASLGIVVLDWCGALAAIAWPLLPRILFVVASLFFLPAAILGTAPPILAKLAVRDLGRAGRTVGQIYAAGSAGSIVGTLVTGFVLVPLLDTHVIVGGVGGLLLLLGLSFLVAQRGGRLPARPAGAEGVVVAQVEE
jgi:predicted membrane-bound spermidine synthase